MPKVKISVSSPTTNSNVATLVKEITGLALSSAVSRLANGKSGWLLTADLYKNDHDDRALECERLIEGLKGFSCEPYILYGPGNTPLDVMLANPDRYEMSASALLYILHDSDSQRDDCV